MMYFSISFLLKVCLISQCVVVFKLSEASKDIGFKRQVFENVVTEIECCKCKEKIKVNPFDMLNYIHGAKTMKEEDGKPPHLNAEPSQPSDAIQIQSKLYFQRFVNLLLLASGLKNFNMESSYKIVSMEFNITYQDLKLLQDFANKGTINLERIDGVLSRILRQKNVKTTHKREGFLADVDFVYYSKVVLTFLATLPVDYPMVCIACFVSMVFIVTVRHMRRYTLFYSIVLMLFIIFCAGFGWNWLRMIKEEEAKIASTYALHLNQLPIHCRPHDMTWLDRIWYYSYEKDCEKYFKEISIDPVVRISPTLVLSETITMMFLHPFGKIGTAFGEFLAALIEPIPFAHKWYLVPLVLVLIFVTFFLSYLVLIGGVISFKSLLGSVEIGLRESRNAGGLPRLDSFRPARQMIENVPREEEGGGGGLRRIEGERVREEEGVERGRGDSGGRGGEREENWRGGSGEGGRVGEGGRRLRLQEGSEREWNEGGGGRERKREENWRGGGESGGGGDEERRLRVQEGSEKDENRRGRGGEGRLRRIEGEREMEENNGGRRFGLQEVREREWNEGGGGGVGRERDSIEDNPRERRGTDENVGEKRDEGWFSEMRRRIGWGGRSGENEGEERRRIERGGSEWNEREGGRKVETQEKEVESSGERRRRIGEEKDGGRRVERERGGGRVLDEGGSGDSPKGRERVGDRRRGGGEGWNEEENRQGDGGTCDKCGGEGRIMRREEEEGETVKNVGEKVGRGERVEEVGGQKGGGKNCEVERRLEERGEDVGEVRGVENQAENSKSVEKKRDKVGGNLKNPTKGENEEPGSSAKKNVGEGEQEVEEEEEEFNMHFSPKAYKELKTIYKRFKTIVTSNDQDDDDDDDSENDAPDISGVEKLKKGTKS